jgi:hypothetical protein
MREGEGKGEGERERERKRERERERENGTSLSRGGSFAGRGTRGVVIEGPAG